VDCAQAAVVEKISVCGAGGREGWEGGGGVGGSGAHIKTQQGVPVLAVRARPRALGGHVGAHKLARPRGRREGGAEGRPGGRRTGLWGCHREGVRARGQEDLGAGRGGREGGFGEG
jgi:hypothetical protein